MPKVHSHYENLKIPRDASTEAIRVAYRTLSQKHHPDRNPNKEDATRIMMVINTAYETLSDPEKRRRHDDWIAEAEGHRRSRRSSSRRRSAASETSREGETGESAHRSRHHSSRSASPRGIRKLAAHLSRHRFRYAIGAVALIAGVIVLIPGAPPPDTSPFGPKIAFDPKFYPAYQVPPPPPKDPDEPTAEEAAKGAAGTPDAPGAAGARAKPVAPAPQTRAALIPPTETVAYRRPATAPNGQPWPTEPAYVRGYQMLRADGFAMVTIDNSRNGADIFAKLVFLEGGQSVPTRVVYVPAFSQMKLTNINGGRYDLRFRDLNSGELTRTSPFVLKESPKFNSVEASSFTLVVANARSGNLHLHGLSENEF